MATSAPLDGQIGRFTCVELADQLDQLLDGKPGGSEAVRFRRLPESKSSQNSTWGPVRHP